MEVLLCERVNDLRHSLFHLLNCNDGLYAYEITKSHSEQGLDYREVEELSWCPSWSNSLWQGRSCRLVHCPGGNATEPIWRVLASSLGISSWTPLKPQHSIPCWLSVQWEPSACISCQCCQKKGSSKGLGGFALSDLLGSWRASMLPLGILSLGLWVIAVDPAFITWHFSKFKTQFYCICSSSRPDCIFEIHQLWQSVFSRVYSNSCCSCSFECEIIKIGQSSYKMYSNKILNSQESTPILNALTKNGLEVYWMHHVRPRFNRYAF